MQAPARQSFVVGGLAPRPIRVPRAYLVKGVVGGFTPRERWRDA